jgi:hypothetical protein
MGAFHSLEVRIIRLLGLVFANTMTPAAMRDIHLGTNYAAGIPYCGDC